MPNELPGLPPLPKQEDFAAPPASTSEQVARMIAILAAGVGGDPERAGLLFRTFAAQDEAKERTAQEQFQNALAAAQEQRQQQLFQFGVEREAAAEKRAGEEAAFEREKFTFEKEKFEYAKGRAAAEVGREERAVAAQNRGQYLDAVRSFNAEVGDILAGSKAPVNMRDLLGMDPTAQMELMSLPAGEQRQAAIAQRLLGAREQLAAAYPEQTPEQVANAIAAQIDIHLEAVPDEYKESFLNAAAAVQESAIQKFERGQDDLSPEEAQRIWMGEVSQQLETAFMDDRALNVDEAYGIINMLSQKNVSNELSLEFVSAALDKAILNVSARLGLDVNDQEAVRDKAALALWDAVDRGIPFGSPMALVGVSDPIIGKLQEEMMGLTKRIAEFEAQGKPVEATRLRRQLPGLESKLQARKKERKETLARIEKAKPERVSGPMMFRR